MLLFSALAMMISPQSFAQEPALAAFRSVGTGCRNNSLSHVIAEDFSAMSLLFTDMNVEDGYGGRRKCVASFEIDLPPGQQLTITSLQYRGYVNLGPNSVAGMQSLPFFQNGFAMTYENKKKKGRIVREKIYHAGATFAGGFRTAIGHEPGRNGRPVDEEINWTAGSDQLMMISPCGGRTTLHIVSEISLSTRDGNKAQGLVTFDSSDLPINRGRPDLLPAQKYSFRLGSCEHNPKVNQPPAYLVERIIASDE